MPNLLLIFANESKNFSLQVLTFANEPWKENFLGTGFRQINQNSRKLKKLVPQRFAFSKIDIFFTSFSQRTSER